MVLRTAIYTGMNLKGEIRESISLDDDDLSDVEDEVFIRDGKNGYKLAEELNVKRPLMAPRRKFGKSDSGSRLKPIRPGCRALCKPCCYVALALSVLIGLIGLVVVLVSIYPIPLDRLRDWFISRSAADRRAKNRDPYLPCTDLKVTEVWAVNFPGLSTDCPVRTTDIDADGVDDIIVGFRTGGDNNKILPADVFCPMLLGVPPPCDGGIMALNGRNGDLIWKRWLNDTIFGLTCTEDVNKDGVNDCLAVGVEGTIAVVDAKNGRDIWTLNNGKTHVFVANFISDRNADGIADVITSHSTLDDRTEGHVVLLSGKDGRQLRSLRTPTGAKTFFMPQILTLNGTQAVLLFGTGTPNKPGNLSAIALDKLDNLETESKTIYRDYYKGVLTQAVLVDINGDNVSDIVLSMYNSTIVAIDGRTMRQIWNYTIEGAVTDMMPTPAFFNGDNVTDFLVVYQKHDGIFNYNYTQTLIIDGLTGRPIYQPVNGGVITQMNGLTLSMEGRGHDIFLFWTSECSNTDSQNDGNSGYFRTYDECKRQFNSSTVLKLNALNENRQPPGFTIYNSTCKTAFEYNTSKPIMQLLREYLTAHPIVSERGQSEVPKSYTGDRNADIDLPKYDAKSNFRHKERLDAMTKDFNAFQTNNEDQPPADYMWMSNPEDLDGEFSNYNLGEDNIPYNQKQMLFEEVQTPKGGRDPRSKEKDPKKVSKSKKKNLSDKIYGYRNVRLAKSRLLHDDETLPTDILKDTYFKNEELKLKKNKLEQRDVNSHDHRGDMDDMDRKTVLEQEKKDALMNHSTTLWDLETEKEMIEWEDKNYRRRRRHADVPRNVWESLPRVTSVGAVLASFNQSNASNTIDVVFVKYWQPLEVSLQTMLDRDIEECVAHRPAEEKACKEEQEALQRDFPYFDRLAQLNKVPHMTVYRVRIQCDCDSSYDKTIEGRCVRFLPKTEQGWPQYLGRNGNGDFLG